MNAADTTVVRCRIFTTGPTGRVLLLQRPVGSIRHLEKILETEDFSVPNLPWNVTVSGWPQVYAILGVRDQVLGYLSAPLSAFPDYGK